MFTLYVRIMALTEIYFKNRPVFLDIDPFFITYFDKYY